MIAMLFDLARRNIDDGVAAARAVLTASSFRDLTDTELLLARRLVDRNMASARALFGYAATFWRGAMMPRPRSAWPPDDKDGGGG